MTEPGRTELKRRQITDAALALFLQHGYGKTSMDQIAADAQVSKQTVYKQFADKETLFRDMARGVSTNSNHIIAKLMAITETPVQTPDELRKVLQRLARRYLDEVMAPHVLALHRLLLAEAEQFPDLAHEYYQWAQARGMKLIESALRRWADQGLLSVPDPDLAAGQFAYLALGRTQEHMLFHPQHTPRPAERSRVAKAAANTFLAAYQARSRA